MRCLLALALVGCQPALNVDMDTSTDAPPDTAADMIEEDTVEEDSPPPCTYPDPPYSFTSVGDTVAPMSWPLAVARPDETTRADLEDFHCDPDVHSIFIQTVTIPCPYCPDRMREIGALRDHWETYGAKWIFIVLDASTPIEADGYTAAQSVSFGWSTNDMDNTVGARAIASSSIHDSTVPWTGVIRASDMQIVHDEPSGTRLDIETIAMDLAP
jgi:hypothetical protein